MLLLCSCLNLVWGHACSLQNSFLSIINRYFTVFVCFLYHIPSLGFVVRQWPYWFPLIYIRKWWYHWDWGSANRWIRHALHTPIVGCGESSEFFFCPITDHNNLLLCRTCTNRQYKSIITMATPAPSQGTGDLCTFNIQHGFAEALIRGMRSSFLTDPDYHHLKQCESLDDVRLNLSETDYAESIADMTSLSPNQLQKAAVEKVCVLSLDNLRM